MPANESGASVEGKFDNCMATTAAEQHHQTMCVQRAAVRKLGHELGIPESQLYPDTFRYLTRLHYCAADTDTYGSDAEWGEHEVGLAFLSMPLHPTFSDIHLMTI